MDQFKKAQEIAKKSQELQTEQARRSQSDAFSLLDGAEATPSTRRLLSFSQHRLAAAEFEGASADGAVTFKMNGQQQPVSAAAPGFDGKSAEDLSKAFSEAMADAQAKSLAAMNEKMQALYASVGLGGAGM